MQTPCISTIPLEWNGRRMPRPMENTSNKSARIWFARLSLELSRRFSSICVSQLFRPWRRWTFSKSSRKLLTAAQGRTHGLVRAGWRSQLQADAKICVQRGKHILTICVRAACIRNIRCLCLVHDLATYHGHPDIYVHDLRRLDFIDVVAPYGQVGKLPRFQ